MKRQFRMSRAVVAVPVGALVGGLGVAASMATATVLPPILDGDPYFQAGFAFAFFFIAYWIGATLAFGQALVIVGLPVWAALHHLRRTGPITAAVAGGVATGLGSGLLFLLVGASLAEVCMYSGLLSLDGAIVGLVIERIAYRHAEALT